MHIWDEALAEGRQLLVALVRGEVAFAEIPLLPLPVGARHARDDPRHPRSVLRHSPPCLFPSRSVGSVQPY